MNHPLEMKTGFSYKTNGRLQGYGYNMKRKYTDKRKKECNRECFLYDLIFVNYFI